MPHISMHTPIADLTIFENDGAIVALDWGWTPEQETSALLSETKSQIDAYFDGELTQFNLPLNPFGTDHQVKVWDTMQKIKYGDYRSYGDLAKNIGSSAQAVGTACGRNPIPIIIPCHRIISTGQIGSEKWLGGYSGEGGAWTKKALLILEQVLPPDLV